MKCTKKWNKLFLWKWIILCKVIMKPSFAHKKDIKKSVKSTYAQSYPHFPQKNMETRPKNTVKNRKYVLCKMLKKNYLSIRSTAFLFCDCFNFILYVIHIPHTTFHKNLCLVYFITKWGFLKLFLCICPNAT